MELLQLGKGVLPYYRKHVRGNEDIDQNLAQRKLTRNVLLAKKALCDEQGKVLYLYGNLEILVVNDTIVWIKNHPGRRRRGLDPNLDLYTAFSRLLDIDLGVSTEAHYSETR